MRHTHLIRPAWWPVSAAFVLAMLTALPAHAAGSRVSVSMDPVTICQPEGTDSLTLFIMNPLDSIAGMLLRFQLDRPDICRVVPGFDTTGTLLSGWKYVDVRSLGPAGTDFQITALSEYAPFTPPPNRGFPPHPTSGFLPLIRIPVKLLPIPDSMYSAVAQAIPGNTLSTIQFSDPNGNMVGLGHKWVWDTTCFRCTQPGPSGCLQWQQVTTPPCDSMAITYDLVPYFDSTQTYVTRSSIRRCCPNPLVGDVDGNGISMTISDYVTLIRFVAGGQAVSINPMAADLNGDCRISWDDVRAYDSLFKYGCGDFGPCRWLAECTCPHPVRYCCQGGRGNVTNDVDDIVDIEDLFALIDHLALVRTATCLEEADVDGSGTIDISDVMYLVDFLDNAVSVLPPCP